ncbi:MAG: restriction endonuclease subunit S, partial [Smithella sp.]|nr:restriction endonuclease subunit S [Smithella sp.]
NRGVRVVKSQLKENGEFPVFQNSLVPLGYHSSWNYPANSTFIIVAGAAGEIGFSKINFWAADDCFVIPDSINLNSRFVYYFLLTKQNYLFSRVRKASVPRLSRNFIENIKIPVPPLHIQEEIIAILDRFEALVSDLKDGLPAEIAARRKQYEYYRSQLLTFKPKPPHPL